MFVLRLGRCFLSGLQTNNIRLALRTTGTERSEMFEWGIWRNNSKWGGGVCAGFEGRDWIPQFTFADLILPRLSLAPSDGVCLTFHSSHRLNYAQQIIYCVSDDKNALLRQTMRIYPINFLEDGWGERLIGTTDSPRYVVLPFHRALHFSNYEYFVTRQKTFFFLRLLFAPVVRHSVCHLRWCERLSHS